jgi:hypothetical protein
MQPSKFELVTKLKTAATLGIALATPCSIAPTKVIEPKCGRVIRCTAAFHRTHLLFAQNLAATARFQDVLSRGSEI